MTTELPLKGKTALITGGAGGIGAASAAALLRDGATVLLMGRRRDALEQSCQQLRAQVPDADVHLFAGDAGRSGDVQAALKLAWSLRNRLDIVVPTVGGGGFRPFLMHDEDSFRAELELNIVSAFTAIRHAAPLMARNGGGSIVCISSSAARLSFKWLSAYCTAKAGLEGLVRVAAEELSSAGIRVNAVRPGLTQTDATAPIFDDPAMNEAFLEQIPLSRVGKPEDIAEAVRYLAGPKSAWVTGQSFAVDGGNELRKNPELDSAIRQLYGEAALQAVRVGQVPAAV